MLVRDCFFLFSSLSPTAFLSGAYLKALTLFFWTATPLVVSVVSFALYVLLGTHRQTLSLSSAVLSSHSSVCIVLSLGNRLDAETAFTSLALFNILR